MSFLKKPKQDRISREACQGLPEGCLEAFLEKKPLGFRCLLSLANLIGQFEGEMQRQ